jgi:hypothetical protein
MEKYNARLKRHIVTLTLVSWHTGSKRLFVEVTCYQITKKLSCGILSFVTNIDTFHIERFQDSDDCAGSVVILDINFACRVLVSKY